MAGRPIKVYSDILYPITCVMDDGTIVPHGEIIILCPICYSSCVGMYGSQKLKAGIWPKFQCKNPLCPALEYLKKGKQFTLQTSALFKDALTTRLSEILSPLLRGDTTQEALGKFYNRSPSLMTYIRKKVEDLLEKGNQLENLVLNAPMDDAIAMDEMFLKIEGKAVYVIMATSYGSKKVLGIKVGQIRDEQMMRIVFDEAEKNNGKQFSLITIDAWGGSMKMAKSLLRPISVVIHKHKSPYDRAVLWNIEYKGTKRIIHKVGVKTDFFKKRCTREYHYLVEIEDLTVSPPKKRGRPKGTKNGQGKGAYKKKPKNEQKKRGPKGVFLVFDKGKKGYAKVDPGRMKVRIAKGGSTAVAAVLNQVILFFSRMTIQNNLAENKNSVVEHRVWRSGPKDDLSIERRLRTFLYFLNNPGELAKVRIDHRLRGDLVYKEMRQGLLGQMRYMNCIYNQKILKTGGVN